MTLTCERCNQAFERKAQNQRFCDDRCSQLARTERKAARRLALRHGSAEAAAARACPICGDPLVGQANQVYCSKACRNKVTHAKRLERDRQEQRERQARRPPCADCAGPMVGLRTNAVRCRECALRKKNRPSTARRRPVAAPRPKPAPKPAKSKAARPPEEEAPKPDMTMPNLSGDWFPGWDGPWSPNVEPHWRPIIERMFGPAPAPVPAKRAS